MQFCSLLFSPLLLSSPPSLAFRWYLGLICACFGFKRKINSKKVSRGQWPGQSQSKVDYWLSCRQHGFHIGTSATQISHLYYAPSENQSQDLKCGKRSGSHCSVENRNTFVLMIQTLFSAQEMGVGVMFFIPITSRRQRYEFSMLVSEEEWWWLFFHLETMFKTKCESINSPCYQILWNESFGDYDCDSQRELTAHIHTLPLTVTLENKDYHTTNSVNTEHVFTAIILSCANVRSCWTVMAGRCIKADVTISNGSTVQHFTMLRLVSGVKETLTVVHLMHIVPKRPWAKLFPLICKPIV